MDDTQPDVMQELTLDGNAVAGMLHEIFGEEMTDAPAECDGCGRVGEMATMMAFTQAPGLVLRCPACEAVVLRIVQTPDATYIDARGAAYVKLPRAAAR